MKSDEKQSTQSVLQMENIPKRAPAYPSAYSRQCV